MKKTTVYIPTKVEDEKPPAEKMALIKIVGSDIYFPDRINVGDELGNVTHWLKPQTGFFFTKEELNKLISEIMEFTRANSDQCDLKNQYLKKKGLL